MYCSKIVFHPFLVAIVFVAFASQAGCNRRPAFTDIYDSNIKKVHVLYNVFLEGNGYRGPKDEADFKGYLSSDPTARHLVKRLELDPDNLDEIFISERDGEPFVIRYGLNGIQDHAIVFEKIGVEGMRFVAFVNPVELDTTTYDGYLTGKTETAGPKVEQGVAPGE